MKRKCQDLSSRLPPLGPFFDVKQPLVNGTAVPGTGCTRTPAYKISSSGLLHQHHATNPSRSSFRTLVMLLSQSV